MEGPPLTVRLYESEDHEEPIDRRVVEADMSFDDIRSALQSALTVQIVTQHGADYDPDKDGDFDADDDVWVRDVYDDRVIYRSDGVLFQRSYSIVDAKVTLGDPAQVEQVTSYQPVAETIQKEAAHDHQHTHADGTDHAHPHTHAANAAAHGKAHMHGHPAPVSESIRTDGALPLREAEGGDGNVFDILVIQPGTSKNGRRYRAPVLSESTPLLEGARSFLSDGPDHDPRKRGVGSLCGWFDQPRYETNIALPNGKVAEGLVGTYHVTDSKLATTLRESLKEGGKPDLITFSIVADGQVARVREGQGTVIDVQRITAYESVDPVIHAAAGGMAVRLVASVENAHMDWAKLTLAEAVKGLALGTFTIDELKANRSELAESILAGKLAEAAPVKVAEAVPAQTPDVAKLVEAALAAQMAPIQTAQLLESRLASRPALPQPVRDRIRSRANDRVLATKAALSEADVDAIVKEEVDFAAALNPAIVKEAGKTEVEPGKSEVERVTEAMYNIFAGKSNDSLKAMYIDLTGDRSFTGKVQESSRLSESISSTTFSNILGDSITRRMLEIYQLPDLSSWQKIVNIVPTTDFRTQHRLRMGGYGNLPAVAQGGTYTALTTPGDEDATYTVSKRGGTEDVTMETIVNDDLGAIRQIPVRLGRAAGQTLHEFVFDFLRTNPTVYDTLALAHTTHNNKGTSALAASTLIAGRVAMIKQADLTNGKRLGLKPRYIVIPVDLEQTAFELLQTTQEPGSANNTLNFIRSFNVEPIVVEYWTDLNDWWLVADPTLVPTVELGFLNGNQDPELFLQDMPTIGNVFSNDKLTYKIRHIYGGAVMDFRGFYGAIVP